ANVETAAGTALQAGARLVGGGAGDVARRSVAGSHHAEPPAAAGAQTDPIAGEFAGRRGSDFGNVVLSGAQAGFVKRESCGYSTRIARTMRSIRKVRCSRRR